MILLVDAGNLAMRCLFSSRDSMHDVRLFRYIYFNTLFANIKNFQPNEVVLACDGKGYWRKQLYPQYKKSRKSKREAIPIDFNAVFDALEEINRSIRELLPIKVLKIPRCEADDIIAVLARKLKSEKIIISADYDFAQLLSLSHVKIWNPMIKKWISSENPKIDLFIKIIIGDSGDEVPNLKKGVGPQTAKKLAEKGIEEIKRWVVHENLEKEFKRNNLLVNLFHIPQPVEKIILHKYHKYQLPIPEPAEFAYKYGFRRFIDQMDMFEGIFYGLSG